MKTSYLIPALLLGLTACTAPSTSPNTPVTASAASPLLVKHVLCGDLKPDALATYTACQANAPATQTTDALCLDILDAVLDSYPECRAPATGGAPLVVSNIAPAPVPQDRTVTSNSRGAESRVASTTTSVIDGVRSVSITINDVTKTLSSDPAAR